MKNLKLLTTLFFLSASTTFASEMKLKPFETDGCTMFVDGTNTNPKLWRHCCVEHDLRYWFGGSSSDMDSTDLRLRECVLKVAGDNWAMLIYNGVRAGHYSPIKNKHYWGWAWSVKREKFPLSPDETNYVLSELKNLNVPEVNMDEFIRINLP